MSNPGLGRKLVNANGPKTIPFFERRARGDLVDGIEPLSILETEWLIQKQARVSFDSQTEQHQ
jgi:hypothetical protein